MTTTQPPPNDDTPLDVPKWRIVRRGDNGNGGQTNVLGRPAILGKSSNGKIITAVSTESGGLVITIYEVSSSGGISFVENEALAINGKVVSSPSLGFGVGDTAFASAVALSDGALRVDLWSLSGGLHHVRGTTDPSIRCAGSPTIASAIETNTGRHQFFVAVRLAGSEQLSVTKWVSA